MQSVFRNSVLHGIERGRKQHTVTLGHYCINFVGHCGPSSFDPPNGTYITHQVGDTNIMIECVIYDSNGAQVTTNWNIFNFRGVAGGRAIKAVLGDTILTGTKAPSSPFGTFRNMLIFPEFIEDMDGATLTCGFPDPKIGLRAGEYFLRTYRKSPNMPPLHC